MTSPTAHEWARIMIVDDEEVNVLLLRRILSQTGYANIQSTTDSRQALGLFKEFQPDAVVLDLMMPPPDGFEVMAQLREATPEGRYLPIVVVTADATTETRLRAIAAGATEFLTKPVDVVEVRLRMENLLQTCLLYRSLAEHNTELETRVAERTREIQDLWLTTIDRLALIAEFRDDETHQHTERVGRLSDAIAREMSLPPEIVEPLEKAARLHDVGKIAVPDHILLKPGPLTTAEFEEMKAHTVVGARIVGGTASPVLQMAHRVALFHHERWDGAGYNRLAGDDIPLEARIVCVADVFDALTSVRPYKEAWPLERVFEEMCTQAGRQFDPDVVDAFLRLTRRTDPAEFIHARGNIIQFPVGQPSK